jgi:hypothetical protein
MVNKPALRDVAVADIHAFELKYDSDHLNDQSLGGNSRYCDAENDIGITISVGTTSKNMMVLAVM